MGASAKNLDFSGVKERGNFNPKQVAEGDYLATIVKVEDGQSKKDEEFQYIFTIKLEKFSQHSYPYYCKLVESQLWKLRNLLVAAGMNVPKQRMKLDPNKVVGKKVGVTMADDEYEGKMKSVVDAIFPASELTDSTPAGGDDDFEEAPVKAAADDEEPKKKKKDKKKKKSEENLEDIDISDV